MVFGRTGGRLFNGLVCVQRIEDFDGGMEVAEAAVHSKVGVPGCFNWDNGGVYVGIGQL